MEELAGVTRRTEHSRSDPESRTHRSDVEPTGSTARRVSLPGGGTYTPLPFSDPDNARKLPGFFDGGNGGFEADGVAE